MRWSKLLALFGATIIMLPMVQVDAAEPVPIRSGPEWLFQAPTDGEIQDAESYSEFFGVATDEALLNLRLQYLAAQLEEHLLSDLGEDLTYTEVIHAPVFTIRVAVAANPEVARRSVAKFLDSAGVDAPNLVTVMTTPHRAADLHDRAEDLSAALHTLDLQSALRINMRTGRIEVVTDKPDLLLANLARVPDVAPLVDVEYAAEFDGPEANAYAGMAMTGCSSGFSVKQGSTKGILTAGHCQTVQHIWTGGTWVSLSHQAEADGGAVDMQWHTRTSGLTFKPWATDPYYNSTPYYRVITAQTHTYPLNTYVCKYGKATYYTCGTIEHTSYDPDGILSKYSAHFVEVENGSGGNLSSSGDSGAGWFSGSIAYGIHHKSGIWEPNNAVFSKISGIDSLNVLLILG